jgi:hypothetical protein
VAEIAAEITLKFNFGDYGDFWRFLKIWQLFFEAPEREFESCMLLHL